MTKIFFIFLIFLFNSCSFDNKSGIWTNDKNLKPETRQENTINLFNKTEVIKDEFNPDFRINVPLDFRNIKNLRNNNIFF